MKEKLKDIVLGIAAAIALNAFLLFVVWAFIFYIFHYNIFV